MDKAKRQKIFYIPGMISLIFVPIAFIYFASKQQKRLLVSTIPFFCLDTNYLKKQNLLSRFYRHFPPNRNYTEIILTGNNKNDETKLNFSQIRIREILSGNDSLNGLHFKFMDSSEYWTIIKALDILTIEGAKTYIPLDNNLWFYYEPPDVSPIKSINLI